ncbi:MAG: 6-phosphogluconolactonase [Halanaerobiales bacterium]
MYQLKARRTTKVNWKNLNMFLVDERYVNTDSKKSNFKIKKYLLNNINIPSENIKDINYLNSIDRLVKEDKEMIVEHFSLSLEKTLCSF